MKFTQFRNGRSYRRLEDQAIFKIDDVSKLYYKINEKGVWTVSEDLKISDEFEEFNGIIGADRFEDLFHKYKTGDAETQARYFDLLILNMAKELDKLREK